MSFARTQKPMRTTQCLCRSCGANTEMLTIKGLQNSRNTQFWTDFSTFLSFFSKMNKLIIFCLLALYLVAQSAEATAEVSRYSDDYCSTLLLNIRIYIYQVYRLVNLEPMFGMRFKWFAMVFEQKQKNPLKWSLAGVLYANLSSRHQWGKVNFQGNECLKTLF